MTIMDGIRFELGRALIGLAIYAAAFIVISLAVLCSVLAERCRRKRGRR